MIESNEKYSISTLKASVNYNIEISKDMKGIARTRFNSTLNQSSQEGRQRDLFPLGPSTENVKRVPP
jgi:hypothetical protein